MKITLRKSFIGALLLGAIAFGPQPEASAAGSCPTGATATLEDFPPYKYELRPSHNAELDALAGKLASTLSTRLVKRVRIVGHAAKYGSSDFAKTAAYRAAVVEAELKSRLSSRGIDYTKIKFETFGKSTDCPVDSNSTKAGRAKNRRVDVFIDSVAKPKPKPPAPKAKKLTTRDALISLRKSTSNPTTQCLVDRVLDGSADHAYLPDDGLATFMKLTPKKTGIHGYTDHERDLKEWMNQNVRRIRKVPTKQSDQQRFNNAFMSAQKSLLAGVRDLEGLECYDKRTPAVRSYILRQTKRPKSVYSCPVVKKQVESIIKAIGGVHGCTRY